MGTLDRWMNLLPAIALLTAGCAHVPASTPGRNTPEFLYVWGSVHDTTPPVNVRAPRAGRGTAMLTINLRDGSATHGQVTNVILADTAGRFAHHVEHALAPDGLLFANDFGSGTTHRFDMNAPASRNSSAHSRPQGPSPIRTHSPCCRTAMYSRHTSGQVGS